MGITSRNSFLDVISDGEEHAQKVIRPKTISHTTKSPHVNKEEEPTGSPRVKKEGECTERQSIKEESTKSPRVKEEEEPAEVPPPGHAGKMNTERFHDMKVTEKGSHPQKRSHSTSLPAREENKAK